MTAWIKTLDRGEHTGRTMASIVRRVYGRGAYVRWDGQEAGRGYIVAPAHRDDDARVWMDTLIDFDGDLGVERDHEAEAEREKARH